MGLSFEYELGILKPWSVGDGVDMFESGPAVSDGGEGLSELVAPPDG